MGFYVVYSSKGRPPKKYKGLVGKCSQMFGLIKGFSFKVVQLILYLVGAVKLFHLQNIKTDIDNLDHVVDVDVDDDLVVGSSRKAG